MIDEAATAGLIDAVFDLLPGFYNGDKEATLESLRTHGYRPARGNDGQPMMARKVNEMIICIVIGRPLPRIDLVGPGAASYLEVLETVLQDRNFQVAKSTREGEREIRTYSASAEGPVMAVTMIRPLGTDNVLSAVVVPPAAIKAKVGR